MPLLSEPLSGNNSDAPIASVVPVELMIGDDDEDTAPLHAMSQDAGAYLRSFSWCKEVRGSFFGGGVGGIIAGVPIQHSPRPIRRQFMDLDNRR